MKKDGCLDIVEKGAYGLPTVYFQRALVIVSEIVLFLALQWYIQTSKTHAEARRVFVVASSLVLSPGLLIVDHIHFQYNGMMYGFMVFMINSARLEKHLWCGFWFSLLLCFKHIYLYLAPAVFVYLLRAYCLDLHYNKRVSFFHNFVSMIRFWNLVKLGLVVISVFSVAFAPFVYYKVMPNILLRLFPFSRGLTHAYWAPNVWALYSFADRALIQLYNRVPLSRIALQTILKCNPKLLLDSNRLKSATRGIVGDSEFFVLPPVTPQLTFLLTLFYQVMALIPVFIQPTFERFVGALTLCAFSSFLFGWHVHEKAILLVIFPLSFLVSRDRRLLPLFNLLTSSGYVSLFPLIFTCNEWPIKVVYTLLWYIIYYFHFRKVVRITKDATGVGIERATNLYVLGLIPVVLLITIVEVFELKWVFLRKLEFMKLMVISVYCAGGIVSLWVGFNWLYFVDELIWDTLVED